MSCSQYGVPKSYANYPEYSAKYYAPSTCSPSYQQPVQMNLSSLMPGSWNNIAKAEAMNSCPESWDRYAATPEGVQNYISGSGGIRFSTITRDPLGAKYGQRNLLRSIPNTAITMTDEPWFNGSSHLSALTHPEYRQYIGCGQ